MGTGQNKGNLSQIEDQDLVRSGGLEAQKEQELKELFEQTRNDLYSLVRNRREMLDIQEDQLNSEFADYLLKHPDCFDELKEGVNEARMEPGLGSKDRQSLDRLATFLGDIGNIPRMEKDYREFLSKIHFPKKLGSMHSWEIRRLNLYLGMNPEEAEETYHHLKKYYDEYQHGGEDGDVKLKKSDRNFESVWNSLKENYGKNDKFVEMDYGLGDENTADSLKNFLGENGDNWEGREIDENMVPDLKDESSPSIVEKSAVVDKFNRLNNARIENNKKVLSEIELGSADVKLTDFLTNGTDIFHSSDSTIKFDADMMMKVYESQILQKANGGSFVNNDEILEMINDNNGEIKTVIFDKLDEYLKDNISNIPNLNQGQQQNNPQGPQNNPQGPQNPSQGPQNPLQGPQNPSQGPQNPSQGPQNPSQGPQNPSQLNQGQPTLSQAPQQVLSSDFETDLSDDVHKNISPDLVKKIEDLKFCDKYDVTKTKFNMAEVKKYLKDEIFDKKLSRSDFRNLQRSSNVDDKLNDKLNAKLWIIAVQIALTYLNESTDADGKPLKPEFANCKVQGLDGLFGKDTRAGVKSFQEAWNKKYANDISNSSKVALAEDQIPGPKTVEAIIGELDVAEQSPLNVTPGQNISVTVGGNLKPEELLVGFDSNTMTAEFDITNGAPDFTNIGPHSVVVVVKDQKDPTKVVTLNCKYEVRYFTVGPKSGCEIAVGQSLKPEDLLDVGFDPKTMTAEFVPSNYVPNTSTKTNGTPINVKVKVFDKISGNEITGSPFDCAYEVVDVQKVTAKTGVKVRKDGTLKPEDLLVGYDSTTMSANFKAAPDISNPGTLNDIEVEITYNASGTKDTVKCNCDVIDLNDILDKFTSGTVLDLSELTLLDVDGAKSIVSKLSATPGGTVNLNGLKDMDDTVAVELSQINGIIMIDGILDDSNGDLATRLSGGLSTVLEKLAPKSGNLSIKADASIVTAVNNASSNIEIQS